MTSPGRHTCGDALLTASKDWWPFLTPGTRTFLGIFGAATDQHRPLEIIQCRVEIGRQSLRTARLMSCTATGGLVANFRAYFLTNCGNASCGAT